MTKPRTLKGRGVVKVRKDGKPKKDNKGRQTKRTPEIQLELIDALEIGMLDVDACTLAGVSRDFFYDWIKDDAEFDDAVKKARLCAKRRALKTIKTAGLSYWQAAAWFLERRYKDEFAQRQNVNHDGNLNVTNYSDKAKKLIKRALPGATIV